MGPLISNICIPLTLRKNHALVFNTLEQAGYETRFVGGWVRDKIMQITPKDTDIATTAYPEQILQLFSKFTLLKSGMDFGSIKVVIRGEPIDITSLRKDINTDGRHAEVTYGATWEEDALRRDFTINAMSMDRHGTIYDYFSGYEDLQYGNIRFVGDMTQRITEDYLRILRFFRFFSRFGRTYDPNILSTIHHYASQLPLLSKERIAFEFRSLLNTKNAATGLQLANLAGVMDVLFPKAKVLNFIPFQQDLLRILSLYPSLKLDERDSISFNFTRIEKKQIYYLSKLLSHTSGQTNDIRLLLCDYSYQQIHDMLIFTGNMKGLFQLQNFISTNVSQVFPITGLDILSHTNKRNKDIGKALRTLKRKWLLSNCTLNKEELLQFIL